MKVQDVISRVSILLEDIGNVRWTKAELIDWASDGQRVIASVRPDLFSELKIIDLEQGSKQTLPSTNTRLLDVVRNMGVGGVTPGRAVRYIDRETLDSSFPDWHKETPSNQVKHYIYDNRYPEVFYVYPPSTVGIGLEVVLAKIPTKLTAETQDLEIPHLYFDSLVNYVMYRAYSKDTEMAQNGNMAAAYLTFMDKMLGSSKGADTGFSPDLNSKGAAPSVGVNAGGV